MRVYQYRKKLAIKMFRCLFCESHKKFDNVSSLLRKVEKMLTSAIDEIEKGTASLLLMQNYGHEIQRQNAPFEGVSCC